MLELKKVAVSGTLESSDVQIVLEPNPGKGIQIDLESDVKLQFGDSILETVRKTLKQMDVEDVVVRINDKGAIDCTIVARLQTAVCRASGTRFDWNKEALNASR